MRPQPCYTLQIPGTQGRDGQNWTLVETENGTWLQVNGSLYMPQELAADLYTGSGWAYTTVGEEGYARWYQVGDAAGSTMTVQLPENAGFWVYDASGAVTASSVLWDETSAVLPEGGMVVFAGDPGRPVPPAVFLNIHTTLHLGHLSEKIGQQKSDTWFFARYRFFPCSGIFTVGGGSISRLAV